MSEDGRTFCMPHWAIVRDTQANGVIASIGVMQALVSDSRWDELLERAARRYPTEPRLVPDGKGGETVNAKLGNAALKMLDSPPCCWLPIHKLREIMTEAGVPDDRLPT